MLTRRKWSVGLNKSLNRINFVAPQNSCDKAGRRIHARVLMRNHDHLPVEMPEGNWVVGMEWLQGTYTQLYNARHSVFGH